MGLLAILHIVSLVLLCCSIIVFSRAWRRLISRFVVLPFNAVVQLLRSNPCSSSPLLSQHHPIVNIAHITNLQGRFHHLYMEFLLFREWRCMHALRGSCTARYPWRGFCARRQRSPPSNHGTGALMFQNAFAVALCAGPIASTSDKRSNTPLTTNADNVISPPPYFFYQASFLATTSTAEELCLSLGADVVVDYRKTDWYVVRCFPLACVLPYFDINLRSHPTSSDFQQAQRWKYICARF